MTSFFLRKREGEKKRRREKEKKKGEKSIRRKCSNHSSSITFELIFFNPQKMDEKKKLEREKERVTKVERWKKLRERKEGEFGKKVSQLGDSGYE